MACKALGVRLYHYRLERVYVACMSLLGFGLIEGLWLFALVMVGG